MSALDLLTSATLIQPTSRRHPSVICLKTLARKYRVHLLHHLRYEEKRKDTEERKDDTRTRQQQLFWPVQKCNRANLNTEYLMASCATALLLLVVRKSDGQQNATALILNTCSVKIYLPAPNQNMQPSKPEWTGGCYLPLLEATDDDIWRKIGSETHNNNSRGNWAEKKEKNRAAIGLRKSNNQMQLRS